MNSQNKDNKSDKEMLSSSSSSGSQEFVFSSPGNPVDTIKISNREALSEKIKKLKYPFYINDDIIISKFSSDKKLNIGEFINFSKIKNNKIVFLDNDFKISNFFRESKTTKNNIIFSSFDNINTFQSEENKKLFKKLFHFKNKIRNECKISDFCINYKKYFPFCANDIFYKTIREVRSDCFRHYLYRKNERFLIKYFGPRKSCKSIYARSVIANYHKKKKEFIPTLVLDVEYIYKNITNEKANLKEVIYYEVFNLFQSFQKINDFFTTIDFSNSDPMIFIQEIINLFTEYNENSFSEVKPVFCLDNYSQIFDDNNIIKNIENICKKEKKFSLLIIYSIFDKEDQIGYVDNCKKSIDFNPGFYKTLFPVCYLDSLRELKEIKQDLIRDNFKIPKNYGDIFGENVYYIFKFNSKNISFEDFVQDEEKNITADLEYFYCTIIDKNNKIIELIDIIEKKKVIIFNQELLESIPSNYVVIKRTMQNNRYEYSFNYSFPLIGKILKKLSEKIFFIDINHPGFMKLDDTCMSINFDHIMNHYFKNVDSVFGYNSNEIERAYDEFCLEKNHLDKKGNQVYLFHDVMKVLNSNKSEVFLNLKKKYKNKKLLEEKKLIFVFQKFNGKFADIIMLVKNPLDNIFSIVNLQIKLSDYYYVSKKDKKQEPFRMTYLKNKYEYIFNIKINKAYIIYLSLYELPKKFAEKNKDLFIYYSKKQNEIVDKDGKKFLKFPLPEHCKVEFISKLNTLLNLIQNILETNIGLDLKLIEIKNKNIMKDNYIKIEINEKEVKIHCEYDGQASNLNWPNNFEIDNNTFYYEIVQDFEDYEDDE